uniref:Uncharacterized protein n=1 Tax=Clytia hemisphaerica TaxID=252671 RepID=A0A7M5WXT2_9CNID
MLLYLFILRRSNASNLDETIETNCEEKAKQQCHKVQHHAVKYFECCQNKMEFCVQISLILDNRHRYIGQSIVCTLERSLIEFCRDEDDCQTVEIEYRACQAV